MVPSEYAGAWKFLYDWQTLIAGILALIAASIAAWQVWRQGALIKRQLAFSTYLDLDKEWNSKEMIEARQAVHAPGSEKWNHSRLEGILEFFEKLASLFKLSASMPFIYESTLGWYAVRYFLFAREHGQIKYLRNLWQDHLYQDLEELYIFYLGKEAHSQKARRAWELRCLATEEKFWEQERKD